MATLDLTDDEPLITTVAVRGRLDDARAVDPSDTRDCVRSLR